MASNQMRRVDGRVALRWIVALLLIVIGIGTVLVYTARWVSSALALAHTQSQQLANANRTLQAQMSAVQDEYTKLKATSQTLTVDRDNLLVQTKRALEEKDQAQTTQTVLEQVLKKTVQDNRALRDRLVPAEQELDTLRTQWDDLVKGRDQLQQQLAKAKKHSREKELEAELTKQRKKNAELAKAIRATQQEAKQFERKKTELQTKLAKLQTQLEGLQEKYTGLIAENTTLRHQVKRAPADVTRLAQQHERLIKETADMHYNLGVLFTKSKQYYQAAAEFRKVIELRPDDADAYYNLGVIYAENLPDREKALAHFRRYLQINPHAHDASWVKTYIASWQAWEAKERLE